MKLIASAWWSAAILAAFAVSSEALKSVTNDEQSSPSLRPDEAAASRLRTTWPKTPEATAFLHEAVADEMARQLNDRLVERLREKAGKTESSGGGSSSVSSLLKKLLSSLKPALKQIFSSTTKAVKPVITAECRRVVNEVRRGGGAHIGDDEEEEEEDEEEEEGDMSFVALSANGEFWNTVRDVVSKGVGNLASPLMSALAEKLAPAFQKLGEKVVPTFKQQLKDLVRSSCEEAESESRE